MDVLNVYPLTVYHDSKSIGLSQAILDRNRMVTNVTI